MPSVKLADAMIVWTPNIPIWQTCPDVAPAGSICVFQGPDDRRAFGRFPSSRGCCDLDWREGDDSYRLEQLVELIVQWLTRDRMDFRQSAQALRVLEGMERLRAFRDRAGKALLERGYRGRDQAGAEAWSVWG